MYFLFNSLRENCYTSTNSGQCPLQKEPIIFTMMHTEQSLKSSQTVSREGFKSSQTKIKDFLRVES